MAEEIVSRLVAKVDGFIRGFDQAERKVKDFSSKGERDIQRIGNQIQSLGRIITTVFVTGALARGLSNLTEMGDRLDKTSRQLNVTAQQLSNLTFVGERFGLQQEQLVRAFAQTQKNLLDFSRGTGEARVELQALGFSQADAVRLLENPLEAFLKVGEAVAHSNNRLGVSMKVMGESGRQLIPFFAAGREEIERLSKENERLNGHMNQFAESSAKFKDALTDLDRASTGLGIELTKDLIPAVTNLFRALTEVASFNYSEAFSTLFPRLDQLKEKTSSLRDDLLGFQDTLALKEDFFGIPNPFNFKNLTPDNQKRFQEFIEKLLGVQFKAGGQQQLDIKIPEISSGPPTAAAPVAGPESQRLANLIAVKQAKIELLKLDDQAFETNRFLVFNLKEEVAVLKEALAIQKEKEASVKAGLAADPQVARLAALEREIDLKQILLEKEQAIGEIQEQVGSEIQSGLADRLRVATADARTRLAREELNLQVLKKDSFAEALDLQFQQLQVYDRQLLLLRERLEVEGKSKELLDAITLKEAERADLIERHRRAEQEGLGRAIVGNATGELAAQFGPVNARLREAREALAIGDLRRDRFGDPLQLPGTRLLRQIDIAQAERDRLELQFKQTGDQEVLSGVRVKTVEIEELQKAFENLDFVRLKTQVESFGNAISGAINTTVQGVLLGTQTIGEAWNNLLRNILLQIVNQATQQLVGNAIRGAIGLFAGAATGNQGGLVMKFAGGGIVPGLGFADTVPAFLTPGEGVISRTGMEALARINRGEGATGAQVSVNIINNTGAEVETREERQPGGGTKIDVIVGKMVARDITYGSGPVYRAIRNTFGLNRRGGLQ